MKTISDRQGPPVVTDEFRVLVVEDNEANQKVACAILERAGYDTDVVVDGRAAIEALESKPYDLVLMDCRMPLMDGFKATCAIRAVNSQVLNPKVPIIAMTALATRGDQEKCLEAGMDGYVSKPVNPSRLLGAVKRCLETTPKWALVGAPGDAASLIVDPDTADPALSEAANAASFEWPTGLLETIIDLFLEDAPKQIAELQTALHSRNSDALRAISHKLRGSSDILGTTSISTLAMGVEAAVKCRDFERAYELAPQLVGKLQDLLAEMAGADDEVIT